MLVLARKTGESVVAMPPAGSEPMIKVTVLESRRGNVRLGFEAATDVLIHRLEVWERIIVHDHADGAKIDPPAPVT